MSSLAPTSSLRPRSRQDGEEIALQEAERKFVETERVTEFGDTEFMAGLRNDPSFDDVVQLGADPERFHTSQTVPAGYYPSKQTVSEENRDTVHVHSQYNSNPVINHEFRHRGMDMLAGRFTAAEVEERFGRRGEKAWNTLMQDYDSRKRSEQAAELFDIDEQETGFPEEGFQKMGDFRDYGDPYLPSDGAYARQMFSALAREMAYERGDVPKADRYRAATFLEELWGGESRVKADRDIDARRNAVEEKANGSR